MAICDDLPGVEVEIVADNNALKEYVDDELSEEDRNVTRYVAAASGQVFAVKLTLHPGFQFHGNCIVFRIYVDGQFAHGPLMRSTEERSRLSEGAVMNGGKSVRKYCFAALETVSDGKTKPAESAQVKDLGTIKVICIHKNAGARNSYEGWKVESKAGIVSEKALKGKALSHCVEFKAPIGLEKPQTMWYTEVVRNVPNPAATFLFYYRSFASLKSTLIIPRTPTPPPLEERDIDELTRDELRELQRRANEFKKHKEDQVKIKREGGEDSPRRRKVARPRAGATHLELDEGGTMREGSTATIPEREVIELD